MVNHNSIDGKLNKTFCLWQETFQCFDDLESGWVPIVFLCAIACISDAVSPQKKRPSFEFSANDGRLL